MSAMVSATTTFTPTDGNVNTFDLNGFVPTDDNTFAIFDAGADLGSATHLTLAPFDQVVLAFDGASWTATNEAGDSLDLGATANFNIAADSGSGFVGGDALPPPIGPNSWVIGFGSDAPQLAAVDLTAVPVPAAVWLFGSGLLGLVGVARRKSA
jgi:hypothetical protein